MRINKVDPYYAAYADEIADAAEDGYVLVITRPQAEDEVDLYVKLQELLVATLSDPQFHRSAEAMGADAYTASVRSRIEGEARLPRARVDAPAWRWRHPAAPARGGLRRQRGLRRRSA